MAENDYKPFFGERTAEFIKSLRTRGAATVQIVQDPRPVVQIRRKNHATDRFADYGGEVELIRVSFPNRGISASGQNVGVVNQTAIGELKAFAPIDLLEGDRFDFGGSLCEVTHVYPVRNRQVRAMVKMIPAGSGVRK